MPPHTQQHLLLSSTMHTCVLFNPAPWFFLYFSFPCFLFSHLRLCASNWLLDNLILFVSTAPYYHSLFPFPYSIACWLNPTCPARARLLVFFPIYIFISCTSFPLILRGIWVALKCRIQILAISQETYILEPWIHVLIVIIYNLQ